MHKLEVAVYRVLGVELGMVNVGGSFYCTGVQLEKLFGSSEGSRIREAYRRNKRKFSGTRLADLLSVTDYDAKELRQTFRSKRLRKDAVMYNSRDVLRMGLILDGAEADAFQEDVLDMIEAQATFDMVPREQLDAALTTNKSLQDMKEALEEKLDRVEDRMCRLEDSLGVAASNAGRTLNLVRGGKA